VGIVVGAVGVLASLLPPVLALEESLGLDALYTLRGPRTPPSNTIIVGISQDAADELGLSAALRNEVDLTGWPRRLHAELIDILDAAAVGVVAFDIHFRDVQDVDNDGAFAAAIRDAGNVILFDAVEREIDLPDAGEPGVQVLRYSERIVPPLSTLHSAAHATAPFPLPTYPLRTNQFWAFLPTGNDAPTLPVAAFGVYANEALELIERHAAPFFSNRGSEAGIGTPAERMRITRRALIDNPAVVESLIDELEDTGRSDDPGDSVRTLIDLYTGPESRYLNYYGPPQTFTTVPIDTILREGLDPSLHWKDALILVGYSERTQPAQDDAFVSIYSQRSGLNLSGVEIAATALANLLDDSTLTPVSIGSHLAAVLILGLLFGASFLVRSVAVSILIFSLVLAAYVVAAQLQFNLAGVWWPLVVPALIQAPIALVLGLTFRYARAEQRQHAMSRGASRYLPSDLVARIADNPDAATRSSELVDGVCMVTDIESFTAYAETMPPRRLESMLNAYYDELFGIVDAHGGLVTDIVGDSMVAVWRNTVRKDGVDAVSPFAAALEVRSRLTNWKPTFPRSRVGLRAGEFMLGTVGARDHLEYRAIGDVVNSAARIQALNKRLGTIVLTTRDALPDRTVHYREIGTFRLAGMQHPLDIVEPIAIGTEAGNRTRELIGRFAAALGEFKLGRLTEAVSAFESIRVDFQDDGPSGFYAAYIAAHLTSRSRSPLESVVRLPD
jgi:adenylate cyclase